MNRNVILAAFVAAISAGTHAHADALLGQPRIVGGDTSLNSGDLFIGPKKFGWFLSGKYVAAPQMMTLDGIGPIDMRYTSIVNPDAVVISGASGVSFCPALSCIYGPPNGSVVPAYFDHQRATALFSATTKVDGSAQEQTVGVTTTFATGYTKEHFYNTVYNLNDNINVGNATYRAIQAGTSGGNSRPPGTRPTSLPFIFNDGTVKWQWVNDAAINAKVGIYNEAQVIPGGGQSWAQANNFMIKPGVNPTFHTNTELDMTNNSGTDCVAGIANCLGLYIRMAGSNRMTSAISIEGVEASAKSYFGMRMVGPLADTAIDLGTSGGIGLGIGTFTPATYTSAAIADASTAPAGINIAGNKSNAAVRVASTGTSGINLSDGSFSSAAISDGSTAPVSLNVSGTKSLAGIRVAATTPNGIDLRDGSYSAAQIIGNGFNINNAGTGTFTNVAVLGQIYEVSPFVPPTATTACAVGQRAWDANFEYRCVAANTWKRAALSSW